MAYTTVDKSSSYFKAKTYTGDESGQTITVGFQPDFTWIKTRDAAYNHQLVDAVRGNTKYLKSNANDAENTSTNAVTGFVSSGFTLGADTNAWVNQNSKNIISWNWKAGGGQGSSNTDGSINTTYTSANTTSGFSISTYTGTGANATVGHGLGVAPKMILMKNISTTSSWIVYHESIGNTKSLALDSTAVEDASSVFFNNTSPTSSVFSLGNSNANASGDTCIAYCFAEKTGFSKFGLYEANGNADGPFCYLGFRPSVIILKGKGIARNWTTWDDARDIDNPHWNYIYPNLDQNGTNIAHGASGSYAIDFLSNGFKIRNTDDKFNGSGQGYIYMAFGQTLVGSNNQPSNAK